MTDPLTTVLHDLGVFCRWEQGEVPADDHKTCDPDSDQHAVLAAHLRAAGVGFPDEGLRHEDCPDCGGAGWVAETTADPLPSGEPGEPYQVQVECPSGWHSQVTAIPAPAPLDALALAALRAEVEGLPRYLGTVQHPYGSAVALAQILAAIDRLAGKP